MFGYKVPAALATFHSAKVETSILLSLHLHKHQPAVIPAAHAAWVAYHHLFCLIETLRAERKILGESSQLVEQVVRVNVVRPCTGHRLGHLR